MKIKDIIVGTKKRISRDSRKRRHRQSDNLVRVNPKELNKKI